MSHDFDDPGRRRRRCVHALCILAVAAVTFFALLLFADLPAGSGTASATAADHAEVLSSLAIPIGAGVATANATWPESFVLRILLGLVVAGVTLVVLALVAVDVLVARGGHIHF